MNNLYLGFKFALSYFTILPVKFKKEVDLSKKEILGATVLSLPLIGLILGFLTILVYSLLDSIPWLAAIISASLYMVLYGFIHTEAILDVVDAIYAKHSGKDAYKVIKDSTIGAMGLLYALVFVIVKISAIVYLFMNNLLLEFVAAIVISRVCIQFSIYFYEFKSSFVNQLKESFSSKSFFFSIVFFTILAIVLTSLKFFWFIIFAFVLTALIISFIKKNVGFLNGDALGTTLESVEILLFLGVCYLWL